MKTILIILVSLALLSILFYLFTGYVSHLKDCKFRRYYNRHICEFEEPEEIVKFEHLKMVTLNGKIRVFNKYGNWLCDIQENGTYSKIGDPTLLESNEIFYVQNHYLLTYNQLKEYENGYA